VKIPFPFLLGGAREGSATTRRIREKKNRGRPAYHHEGLWMEEKSKNGWAIPRGVGKLNRRKNTPKIQRNSSSASSVISKKQAEYLPREEKEQGKEHD